RRHAPPGSRSTAHLRTRRILAREGPPGSLFGSCAPDLRIPRTGKPARGCAGSTSFPPGRTCAGLRPAAGRILSDLAAESDSPSGPAWMAAEPPTVTRRLPEMGGLAMRTRRDRNRRTLRLEVLEVRTAPSHMGVSPGGADNVHHQGEH